MLRTIFVFSFFCISINVFSQHHVPEDWFTHFEKTNFLETPRYDETMEYFQRLSDASEYAQMFSFGTSPQGRTLYCVIVSRDKNLQPVNLNERTKPIILIVNGIHAGEIGGKDASMLLLREILVTKEQEHILENVDILVVPIFSVDGHERFGPYNRINQNGPKEMGWRTTAQNLNLNRDWMKADAPEMRAMLKLIAKWKPDFIIDTHSTNGADYQYTITYILETHQNLYGETAAWLKDTLIPYMENYIEEKGYLVFPYVSMRQWAAGIESGIASGVSTPRFSSGYAAVQNRAGIVVETHMLKPYKDRVFSTKAMIESILEYANENPQYLLDLNRRSDGMSIGKYVHEKNYFPLNFTLTDNYRMNDFKGIKAERVWSEIAGTEILTYTGEKKSMQVRYYDDVVVIDSVMVPKAYLIPQEWYEIIDRMKLHGISVSQLQRDTPLEVTRYKFINARYASTSYEGRQRVDVEYKTYREKVSVPEGTFYIPTGQRGVRVIAHLLEPKSPDSFLRWGFFNTIFERKEYFEMYVMEPIARQMIRENPGLQIEFEQWLEENPEVRNNPYQRLNFFYERSPYYDEQLNVYPVMRLE